MSQKKGAKGPLNRAKLPEILDSYDYRDVMYPWSKYFPSKKKEKKHDSRR